MKIKNLSENSLNISLTKNNKQNIIINIKPKQIVYTENNTDINKQLLIYEKKQILYINREMDKPSYVDYYKPFFESNTDYSNVKNSFVDIVDDEEEDVNVIEPDFNNIDMFSDEDDDIPSSSKKGRGRPKGTIKKPVVEVAPNQEKKGRGRPKGSIKITKEEDCTNEPKKGRGRPKGSVKIKLTEQDVNSTKKSKRGRPKKSSVIVNVENDFTQTLQKKRGRPKGSINKNKPTNVLAENSEKRKRGRPRKNQF